MFICAISPLAGLFGQSGWFSTAQTAVWLTLYEYMIDSDTCLTWDIIALLIALSFPSVERGGDHYMLPFTRYGSMHVFDVVITCIVCSWPWLPLIGLIRHVLPCIFVENPVWIGLVSTADVLPVISVERISGERNLSVYTKRYSYRILAMTLYGLLLVIYGHVTVFDRQCHVFDR